MEVVTFGHLQHNQVAHVALYSPVNNASDIRNRIVAAARANGHEGEKERDEMNFAFVDATLITSRLHLETAIYQAILMESQGSLRTKTVHSEILWALNPTNNITEAIRRYGISDKTTSVFVVHISDAGLSSSAVQEKLTRVVDGTLLPLTSLQNFTDWTRIKKYHRLDQEKALIATKDDLSNQHAVINNIVVSSVAMKSVMG
ncbi:CGI-121-domain-containing protein [Armillaria luteobubalina]|uniref:EKC/KEOPS complex subunit CGI121 n=1 Tax=Armillaria luteobubalina TaxID=153913 RepID=A0AA39P965_9AGAR|nr:CGI-121-domain-containing protein [Armillaria luteobubalina]